MGFSKERIPRKSGEDRGIDPNQQREWWAPDWDQLLTVWWAD